MNFTNIAEKIKENAIKALEFIKNIYAIPDSGKYITASIILIVIFTFITFPYEQVIQKKIHEAEGKSFSSAEITGLDIGVIGRSYLDRLVLNFIDSTDLVIEKGAFNLSTNPYRLIVSRRLKSDIDIQNLKYSGKETEFNGKIGGDFDLIINSKSNIPENGFVNIIISQGMLQIGTINIPSSMGSFPLKIGVVNIQSLDFSADVINRVMKIKRFTIDSSDLKCSITGSITLEPVMKNSKLELKLVIDPRSKVFDEQREIVEAFAKNSPFEITISGTLSRPDFKTAKSDSDKNEN